MPQIVSTEDGFNTLFSEEYDQTFHSRRGALQETMHVFVHGCAVPELLKPRGICRVLEVGFGTGLNFMATAAEAMERGARLEFTSLEKNLLAAVTLKELAYHLHPRLKTIANSFLKWRQNFAEKPADETRCFQHASIKLELILGEASTARLPENHFDAVYQDAFSPAANPELWTEGFFRMLFSAMKPGARLATYSAKGSVRRTMLAVGFDVQKQPGPKGKREMLVARKPV